MHEGLAPCAAGRLARPAAFMAPPGTSPRFRSLGCKWWGLPLHDEGDLAVHLVEGEVAVLVYVGVAADHLDATDAANGLRRCLYGVTNCVAEGVRRTAYDLADPDDSSRDVVLLL